MRSGGARRRAPQTHLHATDGRNKNARAGDARNQAWQHLIHELAHPVTQAWRIAPRRRRRRRRRNSGAGASQKRVTLASQKYPDLG